MYRIRMFTIALALAGCFVSGGASALAQEATPAAIDLSPNPEQCTQAPRTLESIVALIGTPGPSQTDAAASTASTGPVELPVGEPAPKEAIDGVVATVVENVACFNAGNPLALFAGMTDAYLQSQVEAGLIDQRVLDQSAATPVALPEDQQTQLLDTREFTRYPDGRVGVLVYTKAPSSSQNGSDDLRIELWIFKEVDGRWLLDETITGLAEQLKDMATPAAG